MLVSCKVFQLGNKSFRSKAECQKHIKSILHKYQPAVVIPTPDHDDLMQLLLLHPKRDEKIGPGVDHFTVGETWSGRCFMLVRVGRGGSVDFSYLKCFENNGAPPTRGSMQSEVNKAMRWAIQDQVDRFKKSKFEEAKERGVALFCPLRETLMTPDRGKCHVDRHVSVPPKPVDGRAGVDAARHRACR